MFITPVKMRVNPLKTKPIGSENRSKCKFLESRKLITQKVEKDDPIKLDETKHGPELEQEKPLEIVSERKARVIRLKWDEEAESSKNKRPLMPGEITFNPQPHIRGRKRKRRF